MRRYNQIIGFATRDIRAGEHVHVHNLDGIAHGAIFGDATRDYAFCADVKPTAMVAQPATFMGIVRDDGRVATRNYIGDHLQRELLGHGRRARSRIISAPTSGRSARRYPNVDGVVALTHSTGCGMARRARAWTCCAGRWRATRATRIFAARLHRARLRSEPDHDRCSAARRA